MFYAEKKSADATAEKIMGNEFHCFSTIHITGNPLIFIANVPYEIEDDEETIIGKNTMLISGIQGIQFLMLANGKTLDEMSISLLKHGDFSDADTDEDWQCQRVTSLSFGEWTQGKSKSGTVRVELANQESVYWPIKLPDATTPIKWKQM